jgi:outer membrane scaffolding protein for murein synthesis (MipA/OmpV family)
MRRFCLLAVLALALPAAAESQYPNVAGAGLRSRPAYDGSKSQRLDVVPILDWSRGALFARSVQGVLEAGARADLGSGWKLGAQLAYEEGRKASESSFLRNNGFGDVDPGVSVGAHAEWGGKVGPAPVVVVARWRQQADSDRGAKADLRGTVGVYEKGAFGLALFAQSTWATRKAMRTYYGAPGFDPSGGLLYVAGGALASYDLSAHWALFGSLEARRLQGDAARSPLAETRSNATAVAGLGYRF